MDQESAHGEWLRHLLQERGEVFELISHSIGDGFDISITLEKLMEVAPECLGYTAGERSRE